MTAWAIPLPTAGPLPSIVRAVMACLGRGGGPVRWGEAQEGARDARERSACGYDMSPRQERGEGGRGMGRGSGGEGCEGGGGGEGQSGGGGGIFCDGEFSVHESGITPGTSGGVHICLILRTWWCSRESTRSARPPSSAGSGCPRACANRSRLRARMRTPATWYVVVQCILSWMGQLVSVHFGGGSGQSTGSTSRTSLVGWELGGQGSEFDETRCFKRGVRLSCVALSPAKLARQP